MTTRDAQAEAREFAADMAEIEAIGEFIVAAATAIAADGGTPRLKPPPCGLDVYLCHFSVLMELEDEAALDLDEWRGAGARVGAA